ncbi:MAG: MFS transporter, partial [Promethearchaeota archaeon]
MENVVKKKLPRFIFIQTIVIGVIYAADQVYGFVESNFFNTYLSHVLGLSEIYVSIMVASSATMGMIFLLIWGIFSDNTRSKFGRRKPYILIGGVVSGTAAIIYAFSPNFFWAYFIDVVILGIASNAYFAGERAIIPDTIEQKYRGRANGIITAIGNVGVLIGVALFLISDLLFTVPAPSGEGNILTQEGHMFVLLFGGILLFVAAIVGFALLKERPTSELPAKKSFKKDFAKMFNFQEMKQHKEFFKITIAMIVYRTGIGVIMPFLFIYIFSLGLLTIELLIGVAIGFPLLIFVAINLGKLSDKYGRKKYVPLTIVILSIGTALFSFTKTETGANLIMVFISLPFVLVALLGMDAPLNAWSQDLLPEDQRGKFFGILNIVFTLPQVIGAFIAAIIIGLVGLQYIFIFSI